MTNICKTLLVIGLHIAIRIGQTTEIADIWQNCVVLAIWVDLGGGCVIVAVFGAGSGADLDAKMVFLPAKADFDRRLEV